MATGTKEVGSRGGSWGNRKLVFAAMGGVGAAAVVGGLLALWPDEGGAAPEPTPTVTDGVSPSATASSSSDPGVVIIPDEAAASEIPWDEVGSGWFLLGYVPEKAETTDPDEEWLLGSGETWLLSPTGEVFQGMQPPANVSEIAFWPGSEVWFGLPFVTFPDDDQCEVFSCWDVVAVDMRTGAVRDPLVSPIWPHGLEVTADGSILMSTDCCDFTVSTLVGADGADTPFSLVVEQVGPLLSPDGTALVWKDPASNTTMVRTFFSGGEEVFALPREDLWMKGWIDVSTVLLYDLFWDEDSTVTDGEWLAFDLDSGLTSNWMPPVDGFDFVEPVTTGWWLWWFPDSTDAVVTNNDGSIRIPLECAGTACDWRVSGNRLLWVEEGETPTDDSGIPATGGGQRLTLVDLGTGNQTVIFDAPDANGHIIDIMPHARVYE